MMIIVVVVVIIILIVISSKLDEFVQSAMIVTYPVEVRNT
jgi:hypothetical protein